MRYFPLKSDKIAALKNKTAVVSGATRGIGRAIAERLAMDGFNLIVSARKEADLLEMKTSIESETGVKVLTFKADMAKKAEVQAFGQFALDSADSIQVLVNNAGYYLPGAISNEADGTIESMIESNVYSAYHLTRAVLPGLHKSLHSHIFTICSTASIIPYTNGGSYCISKFALLGMTKVLRAELKETGIRVTAILPGATLTDSWAGVDLPEDRFINAAHIAEALHSAWLQGETAVVEEILIRPQLGDI